MSDNPTNLDVNAGPNVLSDLLEADEQLAREIMYLTNGFECYRNYRHKTPKQFNLGLEADDQGFLSRLIEALISFLVRMIKDVEDGSMGISLTMNKIINRAEAINTVSRSARRINKEGKFKISTRIQNLSVNYKPINDPQRILMYLKSVDTIIRKFFKYQEEELLKVIPSICSLNPALAQHLDQLIATLSNVSPVAFAQSAGFTAGEFRFTGPHLLGNQQLLVMNKNATGDKVEQLCGQEFVLQLSDSEPKNPPEFIEYDVFAKTIEQSILRQVLITANELGGRIGLMSRARRSNRINDLVKYLELIRRDINQGKYEGDALHNATAFIMLLEAFDNWLVNPYLSLLALMTRNMSAILNVCEANN